MQISSYLETYYNVPTGSLKVRRQYKASYKDFFAYGKTYLEAIQSILNSISIANTITLKTNNQ
jgi:hypothetical protein